MHFTRNNKKRKLYGKKNIVSSSVVEEWKTGGVNPIGSARESENEPVVTKDGKAGKKNRDRAARAAAQEERISFTPVGTRDDAPAVVSTSTEGVVVESTETVTESTWLQCNDTERNLTWFVNNNTTNETVWALPPGGIVTNVMEQ